MMVSVWWLLIAASVGAGAGMLLFAMFTVAERADAGAPLASTPSPDDSIEEALGSHTVA